MLFVLIIIYNYQRKYTIHATNVIFVIFEKEMYGKIDVKMRQNRLVLPQNQFILRHLRIECGVWVLLFDVYKRRAVRGRNLPRNLRLHTPPSFAKDYRRGMRKMPQLQQILVEILVELSRNRLFFFVSVGDVRWGDNRVGGKR